MVNEPLHLGCIFHLNFIWKYSTFSFNNTQFVDEYFLAHLS